MSKDASGRSAYSRALTRKITGARLAMVFERLWLRLWIVVVVAALFVLVSLLGVWPLLGETAHMVLAGAFALAFAGSLLYALLIRWPTREEAIKRIERVSGVPHRPASSYEDTLSSSTTDPATLELWAAHKKRMAALVDRLTPGKPRPRTDRYDPLALRALLVLVVAALVTLAGPAAIDRLKSAFDLGALARSDVRLDAWVSPPPYTGRPPVMLADGGSGLGAGSAVAEQAPAPGKLPEVPERSVLIVRASGTDMGPLTLEILPSTAEPGAAAKSEPQVIEPGPEKSPGDVAEVRTELRRPVTVRALNGGSEMARWTIDVTPDHAPRIVLTKKPEITPRGSMKLTYKVEDDYGVASAQAKLERPKKKTADPARAWAQAEPLKGPRWPAVRPPPFDLRLPGPSAKNGEQHTYIEVASHLWAGLKVRMTLEAKDVAGQIGTSEPIEFVLPEKRFTKPLALAVVEQRRKLIDDHRYRGQVRKALEALTLEPDGFIDDTRIYLSLRTVYHRLAQDEERTRMGRESRLKRAGMREIIKDLWQIALRIEDGDLSEAERRLKEAQEKLAKALESGASEEEIKKLMQELRQALNDYMQQLAKEQGEQDFSEGTNPDQQMLSQQDLERMMQDLEDMAKNGSREQAQQLLSEMQDLMERLQAGKMTEKQRQQSKDMNKAMEELGDMAGQQQQLMDETFEELRDQDGARGQQQKGPKPNIRGAPGGEKGREGENAAPGQRKLGQGGQRQPGRGQQQGPGQGMPQVGQDGDGGGGQPSDQATLGERQRALRDRLEKLQRDLRDKGLGSSDQLDAAGEAMERAEEALRDGDLAEATEQQGEALDQLRKSGEQMAEQMARNSPSRMGRNGDTPRDPLGRPQRSQGPDLGTSVKVPDEIDQQRAREILEELRKRSSEASRPPVELDYLERLLKRF